jgi:hypothetical protein
MRNPRPCHAQANLSCRTPAHASGPCSGYAAMPCALQSAIRCPSCYALLCHVLLFAISFTIHTAIICRHTRSRPVHKRRSRRTMKVLCRYCNMIHLSQARRQERRWVSSQLQPHHRYQDGPYVGCGFGKRRTLVSVASERASSWVKALREGKA